MRAARAMPVVAAWLLALGCSSVPPRSPPPSSDLRIWAPVVVRWSPGADRVVRFAIENATQRTVEVRKPDPRGARIEVFAGPEGPPVCGQDFSDLPGAEAVALAPGDQFPVTLDLEEVCGDLRSGEYRYELSYRIPTEGGGGTLLRTRYGRLVVEGPPSAARAGSPSPRAPAPRAP